MTDVLLTITDMRRAFCTNGIERRFRLSGVDYDAFLETGAMASELYGHGYDAHIDRAVEMKMRAENGG